LQPETLEIFRPWEPGLLSMVIYVCLVTGLLTVMLAMAWWLGEKRHARDKDMAYECGLKPSGKASFRFPASFYLVAVFFLIFDIEGAFIFQWAIGAKPLGVSGWVQISFFVFVLLMSLFYVWAKGGLTWGERHPRSNVESRE